MASDEQTQFLGHEEHTPLRAANLVIPSDDYHLLDASAADAEAPHAPVRGGGDIQNDWRNCRYIRADIGGIVKIQYTNKAGAVITEVLVLIAGIPLAIRNVTKLFQYYHDEDQSQLTGTTQCYDEDGNLITNAIKLMR